MLPCVCFEELNRVKFVQNYKSMIIKMDALLYLLDGLTELETVPFEIQCYNGSCKIDQYIAQKLQSLIMYILFAGETSTALLPSKSRSYARATWCSTYIFVVELPHL